MLKLITEKLEPYKEELKQNPELKLNKILMNSFYLMGLM